MTLHGKIPEHLSQAQCPAWIITQQYHCVPRQHTPPAHFKECGRCIQLEANHVACRKLRHMEYQHPSAHRLPGGRNLMNNPVHYPLPICMHGKQHPPCPSLTMKCGICSQLHPHHSHLIFAKCIQWKQAGINENRIRTSSDPQHLERHRTATILRNGRYGH